MIKNEQDRVSDAPDDNWVYLVLPPSVWPYAQLARWDRPIGWWLLLWPCWWSLALALGVLFQNPANWELVLGLAFAIGAFFLLFLLGAIFMRGAGCAYNDFIDVEIDKKVERTASRPIPSGRVTRKQTAYFVIIQALLGLVCLLILCVGGPFSFNSFAFYLGISSLGIVALYPFAKRITNWPQFVLGLAFSWGALMGWAIIFGSLSASSLLLYAGSVLWVIGYDTIYAHQDREHDALVGVRSTARLFGDKTKLALLILYSATLVLFGMAFMEAEISWPAYIGLVLGGGHMLWQINSLNIDDADKCLALFQSNSKFGWIIFAGLIAAIFF